MGLQEFFQRGAKYLKEFEIDSMGTNEGAD